MDLKELITQSQGHIDINTDNSECDKSKKRFRIRYEVSKEAIIAVTSAFILMASVSSFFVISDIFKTNQYSHTKSSNNTVKEKSDTTDIKSNSKTSSDETKNNLNMDINENSDGISADGKVNINYASIDELTTIKGIGPKTAQKIVDYRKEHGNFTDKSQIMNIKGIGTVTYAKMKDMICV